VIAPSGSKFSGTVDRNLNAFYVNTGTVPEWGTGIKTGTNHLAIGQKGGPLLMTAADCCQARLSAPYSEITSMHIDRRARSVSVRFRRWGPTRVKSFQCKLDGGRYTRCRSPATYAHLTKGKHTFKVRAKALNGKLERKAARVSFKI
jgi:hypothetical protein